MDGTCLQNGLRFGIFAYICMVCTIRKWWFMSSIILGFLLSSVWGTQFCEICQIGHDSGTSVWRFGWSTDGSLKIVCLRKCCEKSRKRARFQNKQLGKSSCFKSFWCCICSANISLEGLEASCSQICFFRFILRSIYGKCWSVAMLLSLRLTLLASLQSFKII